MFKYFFNRFYSLYLLFSAIIAFNFGLTVYGQTVSVPFELQSKLIPRILMLNKKLDNKKVIKIGILFNQNLRSSRLAMEEMSKISFTQEFNLKIEVLPIQIAGMEILESIYTEEKIDAIYITPLRGFDDSIISNLCRRFGVLSLSAESKLVEKFYSIGFELINNKPKIIVNLETLANEGAQFSSRFLKIAQLIN